VTQRPILDSADQASALPVPSSVNGGRPKSELLDLQAAEKAAVDFLTALGIDLDREERQATPARTASAYAELFAPEPFQLTI
jgi:GTP cyclohydrolase I